MQLRLASALVVLALAFGATGCAQRIGGTAVADAGATVETETTSKAPTSTKKPTKTTSAAPTSTASAGGDGDVKITVKKKTEGYEDCEILKPADIAAAVGGKASEAGCVQSTENPYAVVTHMVTFADADGEKKPIEVAGNTAWEIVDKEGDCSVMVMLTDDPDAITPAWVVKVLEVDDIDSCGIALKLATLGFERLPNA